MAAYLGDDEDAILDMVGYLVLLLIQKEAGK